MLGALNKMIVIKTQKNEELTFSAPFPFWPILLADWGLK